MPSQPIIYFIARTAPYNLHKTFNSTLDLRQCLSLDTDRLILTVVIGQGEEMSYARHEYPDELQFHDPAGPYQDPAARATYDAQQARYMQEQQAQQQQYREGLVYQQREQMRSNPSPGRWRRSEAAAREREEQVMRDAMRLDAERLARGLGARQQRRDSL
jgi:hypothetical protein